MRRSSFVWPHWQCQQTPAQMIQTYRVFSSPVVRVTSFQALEVTPAIKQAVTVPCGATSSTDVRSDCPQTDSGASLFKMACLFCLSPLPFAWGFCMLYLECIIVFPFEHFFFLDGLVFAEQSQYETAFSAVYTPAEDICHFFHIGLSAPLASSKTFAKIKTFYYCFLLLLLVLLCFIN